ncbi:MAG: hypothetical protein KAV45_14110, partial [Calditrichia bacterium]|nr:hypothetical protein [Calditrichia bacterium]
SGFGAYSSGKKSGIACPISSCPLIDKSVRIVTSVLIHPHQTGVIVEHDDLFMTIMVDIGDAETGIPHLVVSGVGRL